MKLNTTCVALDRAKSVLEDINLFRRGLRHTKHAQKRPFAVHPAERFLRSFIKHPREFEMNEVRLITVATELLQSNLNLECLRYMEW